MNKEKITVSIIEDTRDIRESLQVLINGSDGFECFHVYSDAEEALDKMPAKDINVVLMDINLPGMDGIGCMKTLKPGTHSKAVCLTVFIANPALSSRPNDRSTIAPIAIIMFRIIIRSD